jgi:hypothetical protein
MRSTVEPWPCHPLADSGSLVRCWNVCLLRTRNSWTFG